MKKIFKNVKNLVNKRKKTKQTNKSFDIGLELSESDNEVKITNKDIKVVDKSEIDSNSNSRILREFFLCDSVSLAKKLLGKILVRRIDDVLVRCRIVEVEAYMGPEDKGSHAYNNKKTERTKHYWNPGGHLYVYLIYGCNHCMNIIANDENTPQGVLIRAVEPLEGLEIIKKNRGEKFTSKTLSKAQLVNLTNGPGKVCAALKIDRSYASLDICKSDDVYLTNDTTNTESDFEIETSRRVNIDYAEEYTYKEWRFYIKNNPFVSKVKFKNR